MIFPTYSLLPFPSFPPCLPFRFCFDSLPFLSSALPLFPCTSSLFPSPSPSFLPSFLSLPLFPSLLPNLIFFSNSLILIPPGGGGQLYTPLSIPNTFMAHSGLVTINNLLSPQGDDLASCNQRPSSSYLLPSSGAFCLESTSLPKTIFIYVIMHDIFIE